MVTRYDLSLQWLPEIIAHQAVINHAAGTSSNASVMLLLSLRTQQKSGFIAWSCFFLPQVGRNPIFNWSLFMSILGFGFSKTAVPYRKHHRLVFANWGALSRVLQIRFSHPHLPFQGKINTYQSTSLRHWKHMKQRLCSYNQPNEFYKWIFLNINWVLKWFKGRMKGWWILT